MSNEAQQLPTGLIDEVRYARIEMWLSHKGGLLITRWTRTNDPSRGNFSVHDMDEIVPRCTITHRQALALGVLRIQQAGTWRGRLTAIGYEKLDKGQAVHEGTCSKCGEWFRSVVPEQMVGRKLHCSYRCAERLLPCSNCGCDRNSEYQRKGFKSDGRCVSCTNWYTKNRVERPVNRRRK